VRILRFLSLLLLPAALAVQAASRPLDVGNLGAPVFAVYTSQHGLSDEIWNALGIDGEGHVWAGSASSLARFDGYRWQPWPVPGGASLVHDLALVDGRFWVNFQGQGLFHLDSGEWQRHRHEPRSLFRFLDLPRDDGGRDVYLGHESGLWRHAAGAWVEEPNLDAVAIGAPQGMVRSRRLFGGPRQWLASNQGLWYRELRGDAAVSPWRLFEDPRFHLIAGTDVVLGHERGQETLWVTTYGQGVARIRDDGVRWWRARSGELPSEAIYAGVTTQDADGTGVLWLASRAGLLQIRGEDVRVFDRRHGLPADAVRALMLQRAGDGTELLWLATEGGIARASLGRPQWQTVSLMGARENGVFGLLIEPDGEGGERLWLGTAKEGLGLFERGQWRYFRHAEGTLPAEGVRQIWRVPGPDGRPWRLLSLVEGGLWRIGDDFSFTRLPAPWDAPTPDTASHVLARQLDGRHEWWFATLRSGIHRWRDGRWDSFMVDGMAPPWAVAGLLEQIDGAGRSWLWAASTQGLARFDGERWQLLADIPGLPADGFRSVALVREGTHTRLWAGSNRHGVVRIDIDDPLAPRVFVADALPAPPDPFVYSTLQDREGRVYVCTNNGVQQLTPNAGGGFSSRVFRRRDGLVHDECNTNAQYIDRIDRYWVGTLAGLSMYDPSISVSASMQHQPHLHLTALRLDGDSQPVPLRAQMVLPAGTREVRLEYALLGAYREPESSYRSELVGYDPGPSAWTAERRRIFTRLPPGSYQFRVEARDYAGRASAMQSFEFEVAAFWWQRDWVRVSLAMSVVLLVLVAVRGYSRALRDRQRLLEQQVAARTAELNAANRQLTELSYLDALTGIPNRRRLMQAMESAIARAIERQLPLGVIVIDVDHFKDYNDRFGHLSGDTALRAVAQALSSATREHDLVARHGGEEFACLMVDAEAEIVLAVAERMRALVEALPPRTLGNDVQTLTISAGVLCRVPHPGELPAELLDAADAALYRAKHEGRNRVCRAD
jgi:diguanylate cyclase (GGDEF)-like protein